MTHIVVGYPDLETSYQLIDKMVVAGVDLIEMQIPFSEPIADGPIIMNACQSALKRGITVDRCMEFASKVSRQFDVPFLFMTYFNIMFKRGLEKFADDMLNAGIKGTIVPDLPLEESQDYVNVLTRWNLDPIFIFSPNTSPERMKQLADVGRGFIYCSSRTGVTGKTTDINQDFERYMTHCRDATDLPLAVGFGIQSQDDINLMKSKADIAVIGSKVIQLLEEDGLGAVQDFLHRIRTLSG